MIKDETMKMKSNGHIHTPSSGQSQNGHIYTIQTTTLQDENAVEEGSNTLYASGVFSYSRPLASKVNPDGGKSWPWKIGCLPWCRKYFWEGQASKESKGPQDLPETDLKVASKLMTEYRRTVGLIVPAMVVHFFWWSLMIKHNLWYLFPDRYILVITMMFASLLAGLTSIGGGTVAFPVLTLILNVSPNVARDFSLLIQSFGMTSATFTIMFMAIKVEWHAILFGTLGGAIGLIAGLELIEMHLSPTLKKMIFASFWFSFAFALFLQNRQRKRKTYPKIMIFTWWKGMILVATGIVGGLFTSFVGSGLDICSLSVLTLFFKVSEKQATPTSVVLMAVNSVLGLFWRQAIHNTVALEAWKYVAVCAFVVVIGAPCGSVIGAHFHRLVLAVIIYAIVGITLLSTYILVPLSSVLIVVSVVTIITGAVVFLTLALVGQRVLNKEIRECREKSEMGDNWGLGDIQNEDLEKEDAKESGKIELPNSPTEYVNISSL